MTMEKQGLFTFLLLLHITTGLRFMPETFQDITSICGRDGKFPMFLDFNKPSVNLRLDEGPSLRRKNVYINKTLDCDIDIQTVLRRDADKEMLEVEALSLIILELNYTHARTESVQVITTSYFGTKTTSVTQEASYGTNRIWTNNPTFLLSGQLTGFETIDNRHRARHIVHEQHVFPPDRIFSKFDTPASIQVRLRRWSLYSRLYLVFTSYRLLNNGESCTENEFECPKSRSFRENAGRLCMSFNLACNGLPNCGDNQIPNPDESCYKIHWSSILMSLVSYILLAITLLLCMSCFARILIQWSVRSSLYDIRSDSLRSSSRFFSFFGGSFSRWERPPPTYDEALKHFNPDTGHRPPDPPPYSDNFRPRMPLSRSLQALRSSSSPDSGSRTPPPEYSSAEDVRMRMMVSDDSSDTAQTPFLVEDKTGSQASEPSGQSNEAILPVYSAVSSPTSSHKPQKRKSSSVLPTVGDSPQGQAASSLTRSQRKSIKNLVTAVPITKGGGGGGLEDATVEVGASATSSTAAAHQSRKRSSRKLASELRRSTDESHLSSPDIEYTSQIRSEAVSPQTSIYRKKDSPSTLDTNQISKVVRTSQSGIIPDLPNSSAGLFGISNLIPDSADLSPDLVQPKGNRTSKSGLLFDPPDPPCYPDKGLSKQSLAGRKEEIEIVEPRSGRPRQPDDIDLPHLLHSSQS